MGSAKVAPDDDTCRELAAVTIQKHVRGMTARKSSHAPPSKPSKQNEVKWATQSSLLSKMSTRLSAPQGVVMDGAGLSVQNGQLAQAADRDFAGAFAGCYEAISSVRALRDPGSGLRPLVAELRTIELMLRAIEDSFNSGGKTIVSLKQLLTQLRDAEEAAHVYAHPPPAGCFGLQRNRAAGARYLLESDPQLVKCAKVTQQYAMALLLEHGYAASDYKMFASRAVDTSCPTP